MKNEKEWSVQEMRDLVNKLHAGFEEVYAIGEAKGNHAEYKDLEDFYLNAMTLLTAMILEKRIKDYYHQEAIKEKYSLKKFFKKFKK